MIFLLISGVLVLCAGLLAIVFGIPIKEFSFGNTMIIVGSIVACAGFVQIGLSFVVRELRQLARGIDALPANPETATARRMRDPRDAAKRPAAPRSGQDDMLFTRDAPPGLGNIDNDDAGYDSRTPPAISMPPLQSSPPLSEAPFSEGWNDEPSMPPLPSGVNSDRPRRDVMFTSRRRGQDEAEPSDQPMSADDFSDSDRRDGGHDEFQDARSQPDRSRAPSAGRDGQGAPLGAPRSPPPRRNETPPVTVVKSGVVDAMAYSLYSDGSIEAQTPEGMVRFGSINDLRAHLDQRG